MDTQAIVDFALQVDHLEALPRMGYLMRGISHPESVAAHVYGVTFWAMLLADRIAGADTLKALRMALLHELGEIKLTDVPKIAEKYLPAGAKEQAETAIANELLDILGGDGEAFKEMFAEFQAAESLEARIVRAADKLQMMLKVLRYEMDGHRGILGFWNYEPNFRDYGLPEARDLFEELRRQRPQKLNDNSVEP
ncbi:MAG: HD domain-containing protein [Candidatus Lernaella stagnicola]|nr:HD domain-containing protein [Candidatus Lernaella stagnicola]